MPVISSVECHTISISQYVDHYLQTHAKKLKSYVKDTTDNIKRIKNLEYHKEYHFSHNGRLFTVYQHSTQRRHKSS